MHELLVLCATARVLPSRLGRLQTPRLFAASDEQLAFPAEPPIWAASHEELAQLLVAAVIGAIVAGGPSAVVAAAVRLPVRALKLPFRALKPAVRAARRAVSLASACAMTACRAAGDVATAVYEWKVATLPLALGAAAYAHTSGRVPRETLARAGGGAAATFALGASEGLRRSMSFNVQMMPMLAHYKWAQYRLRRRNATSDERAAVYERLHERYHERPLAVALSMKGFYVKLSQIMSSFGDDFIPPQYVSSLRVLQDDAPSQPASYVLGVVQKELGIKNISEVFESFDEKPLGAASIGQVHRATLVGGEEVVVKVQYPRAEHYFRIDMKTIKGFCRLAFPEQVPLMEEIERQFLTEFDYKEEARLMRTAADNLAPTFGREVRVPLPIDASHPASALPGGMCTTSVLTMELLRGQSLLREQRRRLQSMAAAEGRDANELEAELRAKARSGELKVPMPPALAISAYATYLGVRDACANALIGMHNAVFGCCGREKLAYVSSEPPLNVPRLVDTLFRVHAHQLFDDGFFQGDPHPGNILLLDDGRVGLIDWGQVKELGVAERLQFARLVVALADRDRPLVAELWAACGFATEKNHPWAIDKWATWRFSRLTPDVTDELGGIIEFEPNLSRRDAVTSEPAPFVMVFRMNVLLRGNAMSLGDLNVDAARHWRPAAVRLLKRHGEKVPKTRPGRGMKERLDEEGRVVKA